MTQVMCGCPPEHGCVVEETQEMQSCAGETVWAGNACGEDCALFDWDETAPLGNVYVPAQIYRSGFCPAEALRMGTLFPELVSPYCKRGC